MTKFDVFSSKFAQDIYLQKYSLNGQEKWEDTCKRVITSVCGQLLSKEDQEEIYKIMKDRKFIPGGRYLYSAGRPYHNVNNCFLFKAEDSREGWADAMQKATMSLMSGGGIGFDYSKLRPNGALITKSGGTSTGPISLMNMINESGRYIMQGGSRRSAIWAGLNWSHNDIVDFLALKNYPESIKKIKETNFNFPVPMELTNISVIYDTEFFIAIKDKNHPKHILAKSIWNKNCLQAFSSAEPGFSFNFRKDNESARNACLPGFAKIDMGNGSVKNMEDIEVGDTVLVKNPYSSTNGTVTKKFNNGKKQVYMYKVDNRTVFCTEDHKVLIDTPSKEILKIKINDAYEKHFEILSSSGTSVLITDKILLGEYDVYDFEVNHPEHSYCTNGIRVSNCTEVTSEDDSDKCNLGTVWINRCKDKNEFRHVVKYATKLLLCGGIYSDVPTQKIREVGNKNNRIGLGLGGLHEWLMLRGSNYQVTPELHKWLSIYEQESDSEAYITAKELNVSIPKGVRAVAPVGTIGILAETTTGIEPLFCKAYKRRYLKDKNWVYQYVVDGTVKRLLDNGVKLEDIQDSYDLNFKQRVKFQADVQNYVDMAISSTCNLSSWGSENNNETTLEEYSKILLTYAKRLRGFTVYPDGCRGGQPLTRVSLDEALKEEGKVFEEIETECIGGVCGV